MKTPITRTSPDGRIVVTRYDHHDYQVVVDGVPEADCTSRKEAWTLGNDTLASIVATRAAQPVAPAAPTFRKEIAAAFVADGRRRRLVGYDAWLDGKQVVWGANSYADAERELDALAYDEAAREADLDADRDALSPAAQDEAARELARGYGWAL